MMGFIGNQSGHTYALNIITNISINIKCVLLINYLFLMLVYLFNFFVIIVYLYFTILLITVIIVLFKNYNEAICNKTIFFIKNKI